jgi:hypothetical protein
LYLELHFYYLNDEKYIQKLVKYLYEKNIELSLWFMQKSKLQKIWNSSYLKLKTITNQKYSVFE